MNLVLASASPRRRELLSGMGLNFEVFVSDVDESFDPQTPPAMVPEILARRKAEHVSRLKQGSVIIAADTVVEAAGKILNKPSDAGEAREMLEILSGTVHFVHTGYCIIGPDGMISGTDTASVWFRSLKEDELAHYIASGKPFDKAGGYGIQEWIGLIGVERIEGSYFTVMGLPSHRIWAGLREMGFPVLV